MFFLQKKIWIAWSKLRFLKLPVEKRVRLEVTTDGRHLTFLLTALGEARYGVYVVGSPFVFRELMLLRKSVPMPFVIGGKERECGISISDKLGFNHGGHREHGGAKRFFLDYDYFSGLTTEDTESTEYTTEQLGRCLAEKSKVGPKGTQVVRVTARETAKGSPSGARRAGANESTLGAGATDPKIEAGLRLADHDGAAFSNPSTSELARDSENTSLTRFASCSDSSPATSYPPFVTAPEVPLLDARPSTLDSSAPVTSNSLPDTAPQALRAPYFMHPSVYHRGLHKRRSPSTTLDSRLSTFDSAAKQRRRFRIGFFGTHDREFYTKHYHFPGMNRFEVLDVFIQKFGNRIKHLRGFPRDWDPCEIAVSIDSKGGDRRGKTFLSQDHYLEALRECDFVLSPPGWCMPLSHNLIEAMFCGAIPITNGGAFMAEPFADGINSLEFQNEEGLVAVIERALAMDEREVGRMRSSVRDYYDRFLDSKAFAETFVRSKSRRILVNAEENSAPLVFPDFSRLMKLNT